MKTISQKNALKLFLFMLILLSAKAFSFTQLPNDASSSGSASKFGCATKATKKSSTTYAAATKGNAMQSGKRFKK